jgi:hypothetical protein
MRDRRCGTDELIPSFSAAGSEGICMAKGRPKRPRLQFKQLCIMASLIWFQNPDEVAG